MKTMMKKLLCLGSFIAMILAAPGCDRNNMEPEETMVTRVLTVNTQTKTVLDGRSILWENGDTVSCIAIYEDERLGAVRYANYSNLRPLEMNGTSARIEVTCGSAYTPKYVVYPSSDKIRYSAEGTLEIPVPESYTMIPGNFPKASNIAVGEVKQDNVFMKNAMTLMKFEIDYPEGTDPETEGIRQIVVSSNEGEFIAGSMSYDPVEDKVISTDGSTKLYLYLPEDEKYFPEGTYYFPMPSITLSKGFKLKLSRMDNLVADKSYAEELTLERNSIVNMGKTSDWELTYVNTTRVIQAVFSTLDKVLYNGNGWPFMEALPTIKNVCGKGLMGPYHLSDNEDAPFYFFVANNISSDSWRATGGAGRRFGGTVNDYMLLPGLEGYKLSAVFIQAGTQASTYEITDDPASGTPTPVNGGKQVKIAKTENHTFILSGTETGVAYRINLPTETPAGILEFRLTYEKD